MINEWQKNYKKIRQYWVLNQAIFWYENMKLETIHYNFLVMEAKRKYIINFPVVKKKVSYAS